MEVPGYKTTQRKKIRGAFFAAVHSDMRLKQRAATICTLRLMRPSQLRTRIPYSDLAPSSGNMFRNLPAKAREDPYTVGTSATTTRTRAAILPVPAPLLLALAPLLLVLAATTRTRSSTTRSSAATLHSTARTRSAPIILSTPTRTSSANCRERYYSY